MAPVRIKINDHFGNQMQQQMMHMQTMGMHAGPYEPQEFNFRVTMLDNTKKDIVSAIYTDTITKKSYLTWQDKRYKRSDTNRYKKIYPSQTLYIAEVTVKEGSAGDENAPVKFFFGKPVDSCWMFKAVNGTISAYSYLNQREEEFLDPSTIVGIQLNDDPIINYTVENLKKLLAKDPEALELIEKKNYLKAIERYNKHTEKAAKK